jgi:predicted signal transduction protein with EAL and GGDEF domain
MSDERPMFLHPPWMVGIMLILGALSLAVGLTIDPFWLVMGSPAILTLFVYVGVRVVLWRRTGRPTADRSPTPAFERAPELERAADDESVRHGDS